MKTIYVTVAVRVKDEADFHETIAECDYSFTGDGIISTEIIEVFDENDSKVF